MVQEFVAWFKEKASSSVQISVSITGELPDFSDYESVWKNADLAKDYWSVVVLDRDGTIIEEREYLSEPEQVRLIPGVGAALRHLREMGFGLVVITNQSGIGRGFFDQEQLERVHERLRELLEMEGVHVDGFYICPHKPEDDCACRNPSLGLLQKAAGELGFNLANSIVIGDKACDIEMGRMAGALTFLVRTGYGAQFENEVAADYVVDDLAAAAQAIGRLSRTQAPAISDL